MIKLLNDYFLMIRRLSNGNLLWMWVKGIVIINLTFMLFLSNMRTWNVLFNYRYDIVFTQYIYHQVGHSIWLATHSSSLIYDLISTSQVSSEGMALEGIEMSLHRFESWCWQKNVFNQNNFLNKSWKVHCSVTWCYDTTNPGVRNYIVHIMYKVLLMNSRAKALLMTTICIQCQDTTLWQCYIHFWLYIVLTFDIAITLSPI